MSEVRRSWLLRGAVPLAVAMTGLAPLGTHAREASPPIAITRFHGQAPPPFVVTDKAGRVVRLSDLRGRVVIVNLWATWCGPCRAEMPTLERLAARYPNDLVVIAVSNDEGGWPAVDQFWRSQFPHLRVALAPDHELAARLGALGLPYSLIVDRDGREVARVPRGAIWDDGQLATLVARSVTQGAKG